MATLKGKTLLVANPIAQNGNGAQAARRAAALLREALGEDNFDLQLTNAPCHAEYLAAQAGAYDSVVTLGGDGIIHETANGLLDIPAQDRPVLGVIPVGSGNDYARTLGMSRRSVEEAVHQLLSAHSRSFDVGYCNDRAFVETLSFGLDAAIALDTVERRHRTGKTGTPLFVESGIDQLLHHRDICRYTAILEGGEEEGCENGSKAEATSPSCRASERRTIAGDTFMFAVQIGPTYGGGFRICPEALTDDGLFDLCIVHPPLGAVRATIVFLMVKNAWHTHFKQVEFHRAQALSLAFKEPIPVQIDGERFDAETYDIVCVPHALKVLVP